MAKAELDLIANTKQAIRNVEKFQDRSTRSLESVQKSFNALKVVAGAAVAFLAGRELVQGIRAVTQAAAAQQDAVNNLNTALRNSGEFSEQASRDLQSFASSLQDVTGIGDELTIQNLALAKSFGATNEQAKLIVESSGDLAAATGKSLDEAVRQVSKTLGGFAGELGEVSPAIKELTTEQLRNGEAARILLDQYGGFAAAQLNTFSGAVGALEGRFGDLLESIGEIITENPAVIKTFRLLDKTVVGLTKSIGDNQDSFSDVVSVIVESFARSIDDALDAVAFFVEALGSLFEGLELVSGAVSKFSESVLVSRTTLINVEGVIDGVTALFKTLGVGVVSVTEGFLRLVNLLDSLGVGESALKKAFDVDEAIGNLARLRKSLTTDVIDSFSDGTDSAKGLLETVKEIANRTFEVGDASSTAFDGLADSIRKVADEAEKASDAIFEVGAPGGPQGPTAPGDEGGAGIALPEGFAEGLADVGKQTALAVGQGITQGAKGAEQAIAKTGGIIFSSVAGAFGGAEAARIAGPIGEAIFGFLGQGPDVVRQQVEAFADNLPILIDALVEAAPVFIVALADNADKIIVALIQATPKLIGAIIAALPQIVQAIFNLINRSGKEFREEIQRTAVRWREVIAESAGQFGLAISNAVKDFAAGIAGILIDIGAFFANLGNDLVQVIAEAFGGIGDALLDLFSPLVDLLAPLGDLANQFNALVDKITDFLSGGAFGDIGGDGQGIVPDSVPILGGLATGGTVPSGFPGDSFAAGLTSGEMVIPRDDVERLNQFLDEQQSGQSGEQQLSVTLQVGEKQLADVLLNLNRQGFRTA